MILFFTYIKDKNIRNYYSPILKLMHMKTNFTSLKFFTGNSKVSVLLFSLLFFVLQGFAQQKHTVEASNTVFTPNELTILAGDTVEWKNVEGYHNVNGTQDAYPSNPESFGNNAGNGWTYSHVFTAPGNYDYHCDPHLELGMTGKITVMENTDMDTTNYTLTMHFTNMNPHVGQILSLAVVDKETGMEVTRTSDTAAVDFDLNVSGLKMNHSYFVNFFADHNGNGMYDSPPVDHAWQMELDSVMSDTMLTFTHNTNFTDIMWKNRLIVQFMGMNPHVGQMLSLAVKDTTSGMELDRVMTTIDTADFMLYVYGIENGMSYHVDFYADFNSNGSYDAPPTDHAWRMELNDVMGDTTLVFSHNTNFTDIMWMNKLTVMFMSMTPHVGQDFWLGVIDKDSGEELASVNRTAEENFEIEIFGIENGISYNIDFYADHNQNGAYDAPPTDHAWRIELMDVVGDTTLSFTHNTNFTDIMVTTSTGQKFLSNTKIYPNPANNQVTIELNKNIRSASEVTVYDITGRTKHKTPETFQNTIHLNIQKLTAGIYFVEVRTNSDKRVFKLVKE